MKIIRMSLLVSIVTLFIVFDVSASLNDIEKVISSDIYPIIEDFQVNDNVGRCDHSDPKVAMCSDGRSIVVWVDERNINTDIYAQRYDANGRAIGNNILVNDEGSNSSQISPSISIDNIGNFVITWCDYRNGNIDIYAQRYNANGSTIGSNFIVNDGDLFINYEPSIAHDDSGNFVITWRSNTDVYAQRYDADGNNIGTYFLINDGEDNSSKYKPSIAFLDGGNFVIAWRSNMDIYAQRYDVHADTIGSNFLVNDEESSWMSYRDFPTISGDNTGNFIIVWNDNRNGSSDIYAQRYDADGNTIGANFIVNDAVTMSQEAPSIACADNGNFVIAWQDLRNTYADIYAQRYDADGNVEGVNFLVNDDGENSWQYSTSVSTR